MTKKIIALLVLGLFLTQAAHAKLFDPEQAKKMKSAGSSKLVNRNAKVETTAKTQTAVQTKTQMKAQEKVAERTTTQKRKY